MLNTSPEVLTVDPALYQELVAVLGEPLKDYDWTRRHHQDFLPVNAGPTRLLGHNMRGSQEVTIAATDLKLEGLHTIPGQTRPWMQLRTIRPFVYITRSHPLSPIVTLEGYRIGQVTPVEELPQHKHIQEGKDGMRGIWRTYALDEDGRSWVYEIWQEWIEGSGFGSRSPYGMALIGEPIPEDLWTKSLELAKRPTKSVAEQFEDSIKGLHPELQVVLADLMGGLAQNLRAKFPAPYSGFRWPPDREYEVEEHIKALRGLNLHQQ